MVDNLTYPQLEPHQRFPTLSGGHCGGGCWTTDVRVGRKGELSERQSNKPSHTHQKPEVDGNLRA